MGMQINFSVTMRKMLSSFLVFLIILDLGPLRSQFSYAQSLPSQSLTNVKTDIFSTLDQPALQAHMRQGKSFEGNQGFQLILIRDLHVQDEAQEKIAASLQQIYKVTGIHKVFLEGAEGKISSVLYQAFPHSDIRRKVAREFVKEGYLTGAELAAIDLGLESSIELYGVEDTETYLQNLKAFRESRNLSEEFSAELKTVDEALSHTKEKLFSQSLLSLDKLRQDLRGKDPNLQKILEEAERILIQRNMPSLERWQNLKNLNEIITLTKAADQNNIQKELGQLIEGLEKSLPKEDLKEVVSKTLQFRLGRIENSHFLENLRAIYLKHGGTETSFHEKYVHLEDWQILSAKQESLNMDAVWKELDQLISELIEEYAYNEHMQVWVKLTEEWLIIKKLMALELTRQELEAVKSWDVPKKINALLEQLSSVKGNAKFTQNGLLFKNLNSAVETAFHFYRLAESRDKILVSKTLGYFSGKNDAGVLITGGFHTEGIQKLLEEKGVSYITWTPKVGELKSSRYEEIMMDRRYNLDGIEFSDKRLAWHADSSEVMKMLSTPVLLGQILASINPKGYDALKMRLLEEMIRDGKKEDPRSINAVLEEWIQKQDVNILNFLRHEDLDRLVRAVGSLYPQEVFMDLAKMQTSDPDAGRLAVRIVGRAYQKKYPALVALTRGYFKILKDQKKTIEKAEALIVEIVKNQREKDMSLMIQNSLEAAKLWGKFARKYANDADARARVLSLLSSVTRPEILDLYPDAGEVFQAAHRLLVRIQKAVPEAAEIQEALVKNGVNEINYAFDKAEKTILTTPKEAAAALDKIKRKTDRFLSSREADLKAYPKYKEALENTRQKIEFDILRADLQALMLDAASPESGKILPKGIKSFLAKATYLANNYPKLDEVARILSPISTNPQFRQAGLATLKEPALRIQNEWINQYYESEFAEFLNILRLPGDFISYLSSITGKEKDALDLIDFAMFLADEHERPLRQTTLTNIDGGLAVRTFAEGSYSFYALAKWAEANPDKAKQVFENMIEKEIVTDETAVPAPVEAPSDIDSEGFLLDEHVKDLIEEPAAAKVPPPAPRVLPPSLREISVKAVVDRARRLLGNGELVLAAQQLSKVDDEIENDVRIIEVLKDFYQRAIAAMNDVWARAGNVLDPGQDLTALQNLVRATSAVAFKGDDFVDMNFDFMSLKGNIENLTEARAAYQTGLDFAQRGFIDSANAALEKIKKLVSINHPIYKDLQRAIAEEKTESVEGQIETILSQSDQLLEKGLDKNDLGDIRTGILLLENAVRVITENGADAEKHQMDLLQQKKEVFVLYLQGVNQLAEGKAKETAETLSTAGKQANDLFQKDFLKEKMFDAILNQRIKAMLEWAMVNFRKGLEEEDAEPVQESLELYEQVISLMTRNLFGFALLEDSWVERALLEDEAHVMEFLVKAFSLSGDEAKEAFQESYEKSKAFDKDDRARIQKLAVASRLPRMIEVAENLTRESLKEDSAGKADTAFQQYQEIRDLVSQHRIAVVRTVTGTLSPEEIENRFQMTQALKEGYEKKDSVILQKAQHFGLRAGLSKDDLDLVLDETEKDFLKDEDIEVIHPFDELPRFAAIVEEKESLRDQKLAEVTLQLYKYVTSHERSANALTELSLIFDYWLDACYLAYLSGDDTKAKVYVAYAGRIKNTLAAHPNLKPFWEKLWIDFQRLSSRILVENKALQPKEKRNLASYQRTVMHLKTRFATRGNEESFKEGEAFLKDMADQIPALMNARDFNFASILAQFAQDFVSAMIKFVPGLSDVQLDQLRTSESEFGRLERLIKDAASLEIDINRIENQMEEYGWSQNDALLEPVAVTAAGILNSGLLANLPDSVRQNLTDRTSFLLFQAIAAIKELADADLAKVSNQLKENNFVVAGLSLRHAEKLIAKAVMYRGLVGNLNDILRDDLKGHIEMIGISNQFLTASFEQILGLAIRDAKKNEAAFVASGFKDTEALAGLNDAFHAAVSAYIRLSLADDSKYKTMGGKVFAPFYDLMIHLQGFTGVFEETLSGARVEVGHTDSILYSKGKELADDILNILSSAAFLPEWAWVDENHPVFQEMISVTSFFGMQKNVMGKRKDLLNKIEIAALNLAEILDLNKLRDIKTLENAGEYFKDIEEGISDSDMSRYALDRLLDFLTLFTGLAQQILHEGNVDTARTYFDYIGNLILYFEQKYVTAIVFSERQEAWQKLRSEFALRARAILLTENDKLKDTVAQYKNAAAEKNFDITALKSSVEDLVWFAGYIRTIQDKEEQRNARQAAIALRDLFSEKLKSLKVVDADLIGRLEEAEKNLGLVESLKHEWEQINAAIDRYATEGMIGSEEKLVPERLEYMMGFAELKADAKSSFTYFIHLLTSKAEKLLAKEEPSVEESAEQAYSLALQALARMRSNSSESETAEINAQIAVIDKAVSEIIPFEYADLLEDVAEEPVALVTPAAETPFNLVTPAGEVPFDLVNPVIPIDISAFEDDEVTQKRKAEDVLINAFKEYPASIDLLNGVVAEYVKMEGFLHTLALVADEKNPTPVIERLSELSKPFLDHVLPEIEKQIQSALAENNDDQVEKLLLLAFRLNQAMAGIYERHGFDQPENIGVFQQATSKLLNQVLRPYAERKGQEALKMDAQRAKDVYAHLAHLYQTIVQNVSPADFSQTLADLNAWLLLFNNPVEGPEILELRKIVDGVKANINILEKGLSVKPAPDPMGVAGTLFDAHSELEKALALITSLAEKNVQSTEFSDVRRNWMIQNRRVENLLRETGNALLEKAKTALGTENLKDAKEILEVSGRIVKTLKDQDVMSTTQTRLETLTQVAGQVPEVAFKHVDADEFGQLNAGQMKRFYENAVAVLMAVRNISEVAGPNAVYINIVRKAAIFANFYAKELAKRNEYDETSVVYKQLISLLEGLQKVKYAAGSFDDIYVELRGEIESGLLALDFESAQFDLERGDVAGGIKKLKRIPVDSERIVQKYDPDEKRIAEAVQDVELKARVLLVKVSAALDELKVYSLGYKGRLQTVDQEEDIVRIAKTFKEAYQVLRATGRQPLVDVLNELKRRAIQADQFNNKEMANRIFQAIRSITQDIYKLDPALGLLFQESGQYLDPANPVLPVQTPSVLETTGEFNVLTAEGMVELDEQGQEIIPLKQIKRGNFAITADGKIGDEVRLTNQEVGFALRRDLGKARLLASQIRLAGDVLSIKPGSIESEISRAKQDGKPIDDLLIQLQGFLSNPAYLALDPETRRAFETTRVVILNGKVSLVEDRDKGISYAHYGEAFSTPSVFFGGLLVNSLLKDDPASFAALVRIEMNRRLYREKNKKDTRNTLQVAKDADINEAILGKIVESISKIEFQNFNVPDDFLDDIEIAVVEDPSGFLNETLPKASNHFALTSEGSIANRRGISNADVNAVLKQKLDAAKIETNQTLLQGDILAAAASELKDLTGKDTDPLMAKLAVFLQSPDYQALDAAAKTAFEATRIVIFKNSISVARNEKGISYAHYGEANQVPTVFLGGDLLDLLLDKDAGSLATLLRLEMNRRLYRQQNGEDLRGSREVVRDAKVSPEALEKLQGIIVDTEVNALLKLQAVEEAVLRGSEIADLFSVDGVLFEKAKGLFLDKLVEKLAARLGAKEAGALKGSISATADERAKSDAVTLSTALLKALESYPAAQALGLNRLTGDVIIFMSPGHSQAIEMPQAVSRILQNILGRQNFGQDYIVVDLVKNLNHNSRDQFVGSSILSLAQGLRSSNQTENVGVRKSEDFVLLSRKTSEGETPEVDSKLVTAFEFFDAQFLKQNNPVAIEANLLRSLPTDELKRFVQQYGRRLALEQGEEIPGLTKEELQQLWKNWARYTAIQDANYKVAILAKDSQASIDMQGSNFLRIDAGQVSALGYVTQFGAYVADVGKEKAKMDPVANQMLREVLKALYAEGEIPEEILEETPFEKILEKPEGFLFPSVKVNTVTSEIESLLRAKGTVEAMA